MHFFGRRLGKRAKAGAHSAHTLALEDEMRKLTDQVIRDSRTDLWEDYRRQISGYDPQNNPLGEAEARKILLLLIRKAVARRGALNGAIERSVSEGSLYSRYFDKVAMISEMTNDAYMKRSKMQVLQERLEQKRRLYSAVTGQQYFKQVGSAVKRRTPADSGSQSEGGAYK